MKPDRWAQIKDIFNDAAETHVDERAAFISFRCGGDESLVREIETLLAAHDQAHSFIECTALEQEQGALTLRIAEDMNRRIGPYRVVRELGSGGMGSVYLAERADGQYRKNVAIKLIRRGMDSEFIIRRFRNERQILADLSHPNIAGLLDGGSTEDGLPYFVLEHIDGVRIDDYCDSNTLPLRERLNLFRTVCSAIHYAHKRSIVHRDIKPSNILVTTDGIPKLLDFGIAKLLEPELAGQTIDSTSSALRLMTPDYASPEQIRGEPITPASDVYALGVLLYELLTGHRPYRLKSRNMQEIAWAICEQEPERPSTAISRTEEVPSANGEGAITRTPESVSRTRNSEPRTLRKLLGGDLDAIVLMAMGKQPEQRYASVEELSADIGRHLDGLPVIARKQMRRSLRTTIRSRWTAASFAVLLAVFLVGLLVYALRPRQPMPPSAIRSVAVLPFKPMSQEASDEYLAQGVADSLITRLSNVRGIMVRPTSAVLKYASREQDPVAAGRELGVDALLDGSIQKIGDRIRVTVQLLRTSDGTPIWAYKCDDRCTNVFEVQDSISEKTVGALVLKLTNEERKLIIKRPTQNQEAYEAYVKGRYFWNKRTPDDLNKAADFFSAGP
jgi:serine/threonine protein kinase